MLMANDRDHQAEQLAGAFQTFNDVSERLARTYWELERRVTRLNDELAAARSERFLELAEKERIANRLERLLRALPAGVIWVDEGGIVQHCNPAARALLQSELLGGRWEDIAQASFVEVAEGGHEFLLGSGRWVSLSVSSLGSEPGQIVLLHEVTATRRLQESVHRSRRLSSMGEMLAALAHQVRTPLSSALLYSSHLAKGELSSVDARRFAGKVVASLRHLEGMVNDLLLFAKGGSRGDDTIAVEELFRELQQLMESPLQEAKARWVVDEVVNATTTGSRAALLSVFQNLVMNALQAGATELRLAAKLDGDRLTITVSDNGGGLSPAVKDRLFEPFLTTRSNGTGLGLAVARSVIVAHKGDITLESERGRGTCAIVHLPLALEQDFLPSGAAASWTHSTPRTSAVGRSKSTTKIVSGVPR
jgi:two-component system sensor histidine kinase FlrB